MRVRDAIRRMTPYAPPLEGRDPQQNLLLDFNESVLPPPPEVGVAIRRFVEEGQLQCYPEYGRFERKLAEAHGIAPEQLILTNGSDQGIDIVMRALLEPGEAIVLPEPTFAMYPQVAGTLDVRCLSPTYGEDLAWPTAAVREAIGPDVRLVVAVNPNNPTGTRIPPETLEALLRDFPDVGVLVDEAYAEFTGETLLPWIARYPNLCVLRTFSKALALPSLRLGFVAADAAFISELHKVRGPYDVNMMAVVAAEAQIDHPQAWQAYVREVMDVAKPRLEAFLRERGVRYYPGAANFLLIEPDDLPAAVAYLKARGILVRPQKGLVSRCFRVSVGPAEAMERFMAAYADYLAG